MTIFPSLRQFCVSFLALIFFADFATGQIAATVKPTVSGKFVGNGKNAAIKFVTVEEHEPFSGKEAITLVFTEKDPAKVKKPSFDALFGKLGSALILNVHHDGGIFGCQVSHSAHEKQGFTSLGEIKMLEFKIASGTVSGHVSTGKELDTFGEKWEVDLTFAAPLPPKLRSPRPAAATTSSVSESRQPDEPAKKPARPATGPLIAARKLPLPKDAANIEYKPVMNQIQFSSARLVEPVTKEFSANLKQQGWKDGAGSLIGKQNAILKREHGDAKLTIMIQPAAGAGSVVKIFTEGLDWNAGTGDATPSASNKTNDAASVEDVEAEAKKLLNDALKSLPQGL